MSDRLIYTAVFGGYDKPRRLERRPRTTDFHWYTDSVAPYHPWKEIRVLGTSGDARRRAKSFKLYPPDEYETTLWVDGNMVPNFSNWADLEATIEGNKDLAFIKHPNRDCLYQEAKECINGKLDNEKVINNQVTRYFDEGMPEHYGLWAGTVIYRRRSKTVSSVMEEWAREIEAGSIRDQISLPYVLWKLDYKPGTIRGDLWRHTLFKYHPH